MPNPPDVKAKVADTFRELERRGYVVVSDEDLEAFEGKSTVVATTIAQEFMFTLMDGGEWHICYHPPKDKDVTE